MSKIGFVGLGMMGNPMAQNLVKAGNDVLVFDKRLEATIDSQALGAGVAKDLSEMAGCEIVFIIVNTGAQVAEVVDGIMTGVTPNSDLILVVMSTVSPNLIQKIHWQVSPKGVKLMDAPVSGAPILAQTGGLSIMVGGEKDIFESLKPYLSAMGQAIVHIGPLGMGLVMKLVNNLVGITNGYVLSCAMEMGLKSGLDVDTMVKVIRASSGNNWLTENWDAYVGFMSFMFDQPEMLSDFHQTATKDINTVLEWTKTLGLDTSVVESVSSILDHSNAMTPDMVKKLISK